MDQDQQPEELEQIIPAVIPSAFGKLSLEDFKERYKEVIDQVKQGSHLITGRITYDLPLGELTISLQTLRQKETHTVDQVLSTSEDKALSSIQKHGMVKVALSLVKVGETAFPKLPSTLPVLAEDLLKDPLIKQRLEYVEGLESDFYLTLFNVLEDVAVAKRIAFVEIIENP